MERKHIDLLLSISELDWVLDSSSDIENLLDKVVSLVSEHMKSDVCSIYIYDEKTDLLTLRATAGLSKEAIGNVKLKLSEGLAGKSLTELVSIRIKDGFTHPNFKYIEGINEELYRSFLVAPIFRGLSRIGVLILQRSERDFFTEDDELAVKAIASQLANILENAKLLSHKDNPSVAEASHDTGTKKSDIIKGKAAAAGFAHAKARRIDKMPMDSLLASGEKGKIYSLADFENALAETEKQLIEIQKSAEAYVSDAGSMIFTAHILMLKDREFISGMRELIDAGDNPPAAVTKVAKAFCDIFSASQNPNVREKAQDITDLAKRLVGNIVGAGDEAVSLRNKIVIADELYPSDVISYFTQGIAGAVVTSGGVTSHVAILARSLEIPLVIADSTDLDGVGPEDDIILDGDIGNIFLNPAREVVLQFNESNKAKTGITKVSAKAKKAQSKDGHRVRLMINVNLLRDMDAVKKIPCDGIGLYRTEFPFILRNSFPSEEEQYFVYSKLLEKAGGLEVTFRTLDVGGDKVLAYYHTQKEENPFLGMRSIRFSLSNKDIFIQQLAAILRAGHNKNIRIMFPMISSLDEFMEAKAVLGECADSLGKRGVKFNAKPKIGIMVEIPSVVSVIDALAEQCDFFSIGTNDLIQYILAVDRTNEKVARYYLPHHPAVLRSIKTVADSAITHGIGVSICGDMANNPDYIPFLLGVGIRDLSVDPLYFIKSYDCINNTSVGQAERLAVKLLACNDIAAATKIINSGA
jgi:phosphotransferase system, enzyme I, PtsP